MKIRFLTLDEKMSGVLQERIDRLEARYEMASSDMAIALANGSERETAEKLKWMFDYHVLEYLREQTPQWFQDVQEDQWDRQIEADAASGRLDLFKEQVARARAAGAVDEL